MISEASGVEWLLLHLAITVLPIINVIASRYWDPIAKAGWVASILAFNLFGYAGFLFVTANKANRQEMEAVSPSATPPSRLFMVGRWISMFGRRAAVAILVGLAAWVLIHIGNPEWMRESYWPFYLLGLFLYWLPVELCGQILMAIGRKSPARD